MEHNMLVSEMAKKKIPINEQINKKYEKYEEKKNKELSWR